MAKLNEKTENTKKIIHLMITDKCYRNCPYCCNNQYNLDKIERITPEELSEAEIVFLTGGEPFLFTDPCKFAEILKEEYPNIQKVFVYTNAYELGLFLKQSHIYAIDGLTISIKDNRDKLTFEEEIVNNASVLNLESNWLYTFPGFEDTEDKGKFNKKMRYWQKDFTPATDSIFRRVEEFL